MDRFLLGPARARIVTGAMVRLLSGPYGVRIVTGHR
jgi:hypothetical protein